MATAAAIRRHFSGLERTRVVLEAGGHSARMGRLLIKLGHEVCIAKPRKLTRWLPKVPWSYRSRKGHLLLHPGLAQPLHHHSALDYLLPIDYKRRARARYRWRRSATSGSGNREVPAGPPLRSGRRRDPKRVPASERTPLTTPGEAPDLDGRCRRRLNNEPNPPVEN